MKNKNGITLIALIITIIVMLILVGVTINVALNGGIFERATDAKQKTAREVAKEELLSLVVATVDSTGNLQITTTNLTKDEWTSEQSENEDYLKCTSPKNDVFYVSIETGAILDKLPSGSEDTYYNVSFKDLSEVNLLNIFPKKEFYAIGFTNKDGVYSVIQVIPDSQSRGLIFLPDVSNEAHYTLRYYAETQQIEPWTYFTDYSDEESEEKSPGNIENVKIDYLAGSSNGLNDFTEDMLKDICNITEAN